MIATRLASTALDRILSVATGDRFTCAVVRVERNGRPVFERAYGTLCDEDAAPVAFVTTPFDLASLTKVVIASLVLSFVSAETIDLDAPLATTFVPEWQGTDHAPITCRMLLAHTSGIASGADYRTLLGDDVIAFALERELVERPGKQVIYSDLGFIVLGLVIARIARTSLATAVGKFAARIGCEDMEYRVRDDRAPYTPATECDVWRGRVRGRVHDEKAYLLGGVAAHAGLFSTARDCARIAELYLAPACGRDAGHHAVFSKAIARTAIAEAAYDPVLRRGLGWALKTSDENSCGRAMAPETFGHTGFTGTSIWADPTRDLSVVLLTNAVYYGRRDLRDVRAAVCDAAVAEWS